VTTNVNDKIEGVVIVWKQGYGFAKRSSTGENVFIHRSVLPPGVQALHAGDKVKFTLTSDRKGRRPRASKLELV
jgi:cold shock CspA family protein